MSPVSPGPGSPGSSDSKSAPSQADLERSHADVTGPRTLEAVTGWLAREVDERPLFLFVHLWDVHYDYNPPREYVDMFDPDYKGTLDASNLMKNPDVNEHMAPRDFDHLLALYDGEIRFTDEILGKILSAVEKRGRMSKTLLVITADHGEEFFEHAGKGHQRTLFDEVVRVPLIVRWPGHLDGGRTVRDQVRIIDLMPTLLTAASVAKQPRMQGRDLMPLLRGETLPAEPALCELFVDKNDVRALRTNAQKIIDYRRAKTKIGLDLVQDPREQRPNDGDVPRFDELRKVLLHMLEAEASAHGAFGSGARPLEPNAELEKRIHGLGYGGESAGKPK
jgi:arylsulfatase A-like enzyme